MYRSPPAFLRFVTLGGDFYEASHPGCATVRRIGNRVVSGGDLFFSLLTPESAFLYCHTVLGNCTNFEWFW